MTCLPLQTADPVQKFPAEPPLRNSTPLGRADELLTRHRDRTLASFPPLTSDRDRAAAHATALMDLYRRTGSSEVFEGLVAIAGPELFARVRSRLRRLGATLDPHEVLQDAIVNVFRYPDKFAASRYNAFAAWSATIVDNAIRRQLRRRQSGPTVALSPIEILSQQADTKAPEPDLAAVEHEETRAAAGAFAVLLACYHAAFEQLSDRERFVLQMVEVQHMRYAELGQLIGVRAETIKMVVFRARKRIHERMSAILRPLAEALAA
ncbi:MAG: sigma-70 family RNA polymerase sigma factor [Planctomycetes bacterium]|nr:sigma-70 family RNA polymerase sigma factor [Planctomycetota bacterium]